MITFAILIGIYSYLLFFLGIIGFLYKTVIIVCTMIFWGSVLVWKRQAIIHWGKNISQWKKHFFTNRFVMFLFILLIIQAVVNLIGTFGPELSFDALWYHLTLPKLYLQNHAIEFIPGGLLYYSAMPKLMEMVYVSGLAFGGETIPKLIHFSFGILTGVVLYQFARHFFSKKIALLAVLIFSGNLVVGWESTTAYIDLSRTFFEVLSLWVFIKWWENRKRKWLILSAILLGLAITTKVLAIGSLIVFSILILFLNRKSSLVNLFLYWSVALLVPLPWFLFAYLNTGNPVYPFFSTLYHIAPEPVSFFGFFQQTWILLTQAADPISPIYLMFLPLVIVYLSQYRSKQMTLLGLYSLLAIIVWYFTPRTGGGRFILPYLPAFSMLCAACIEWMEKQNKQFAKILIGLVIVVSCISIGYRFAANYKYLPVLLGQETKQHFLTTHLNFAYGDFYDTDNYFKTHITSDDKVLLYGFHNLYYADFPFVDSSWVKPREKFTHIATQHTKLPEQFSDWDLIYENKQTMVKLYKR